MKWSFRNSRLHQMVSLWRHRSSRDPEIRLLPVLCCRDRISVDVGAALGVYLHFILRYSNGAVAVEPNPERAYRLQSIYGPRAEVVNVALSDREGEMELAAPRAGGRVLWGRGTVERGNRAVVDADHDSLVVKVRRLDDLGIGRLGFLKIDVEGHELSVLHGAAAALARDAPNILVEAEDRHRPHAVQSVRDYLDGFGYRGFFLSKGTIMEVEEFRVDVHQDPNSLSRYVNNFIFVQDLATLDALRACR